MKTADDFSLKFNLKLMNNKINKRKRLSSELDNRINQFKLENKNLYNLELDLISQILQFEKKVGELAQNRNSIVLNISKIKDEIFLISNKIESFRFILSRIIMNNEKKNFALNRKLYQIKNLNLQITDSLKGNAKKDSTENLSKSFNLIKNNFSNEIIELYRFLDSLAKIKAEKSRNFISNFKSKVLQLDSSKANQYDKFKSLIASSKYLIKREAFLKYDVIDDIKRNLEENSIEKLEEFEFDYENKFREMIITLEQSFSDLPIEKLNEIEKCFKNFAENCRNKQKYFNEQNKRIISNLKSKKLNFKIISKQLENQVKRKIAHLIKKRYKTYKNFYPPFYN